MKKVIITFLKGFLIGAMMVVPGVSGGTLAVLLGLYYDLVIAASTLFKNFKKNFLFLFNFAIGALPGFYLTSKLMGTVLEKYSVIIVFLFAGIIIAGIPTIAKKANVKKFKWSYLIAVLVGIAVIIGISFLPETSASIVGADMSFVDIIVLVAAGLMVCISILLPGLSTFHVLYIFGLYGSVTNAIANLDILFLLPLGISTVIGIILLSKVVHYFLDKYPSIVYCVILGFIIASLVLMFETMPSGIEWLWAIGLFVVGLVGFYFIIQKVGSVKKE